MTDFKKHVGIDHLGNKLVIVFREIPEDPTHCLVAFSNTLSEMYHDQLMRIVDSRDAQDTVDLYEVLARRNFGDGEIMLNGLHKKGLLKKVPVENVQVVPLPNRASPLKEVNEQIRLMAEGKADKTPAGQPQAQPETPAQPEVGSEEQLKSAAESKLLLARQMEEDAKALREEAYQLDPSLKKGGRPSKKQQEKQENLAASEAAE